MLVRPLKKMPMRRPWNWPNKSVIGNSAAFRFRKALKEPQLSNKTEEPFSCLRCNDNRDPTQIYGDYFINRLKIFELKHTDPYERTTIMERKNQGCFSWLFRGGFVWKNALVAEVGSLIFISISNFFSPMWNGSIPIDFIQMTTSDLRCYKKTVAPPSWMVQHPIWALRRNHQTCFFSPNLGVYKFTWPPVPALSKKMGEYFLLLKNFGDLVAQLGLKTTCFVGHIFHISNFWSRKKRSFSREKWGFSWSLKCGFPPALVLQHQGESS